MDQIRQNESRPDRSKSTVERQEIQQVLQRHVRDHFKDDTLIQSNYFQIPKVTWKGEVLVPWKIVKVLWKTRHRHANRFHFLLCD